MSTDKRKLAQDAQKFLKEAKHCSKEAEKIFKVIGDPDGERLAGDASKKAEDGENYVSKRLGD